MGSLKKECDFAVTNIRDCYVTEWNEDIIYNYWNYDDINIGNTYLFSGIERINISTIPVIERTSTFYFKAKVKNQDDTFAKVLLDNTDFSDNAKGLQILMAGGSATNANSVGITLTAIGSSNEIEVRTEALMLPDEWHTIEIWYDGSSDADGITAKIDGNTTTITTTADNLTSNISTGSDGYTVGLWKTFPFGSSGFELASLEFEIGTVTQFKTNCDDKGLTVYDLSTQGNNGTIELNGSTTFYQPEATTDNQFLFSGVEGIDISTVPAFERTSSFNFKARFQNKDNGTVGVLWDTSGASPDFEGLRIILYNEGYTANENRIYVILKNNTSNQINLFTEPVFLPDVWNEVEITYDGSSDASGLTLTINDVPTSFGVNQNDLSLSISTGVGATIGLFKTVVATTGGMTLDSLEWTMDSTAEFKTECNDVNLICEDLSGQGNDGDIELNGSTSFYVSNTPVPLPEIQPSDVQSNKIVSFERIDAGVFASDRYGIIGKHSELDIQNFEIEIDVVATSTGAREFLFSNNYNDQTGSNSGFNVQLNLSGGLSMSIKTSLGSQFMSTSNLITDGVNNTITCKKYGTNVELILNDVTKSLSLNDTITYLDYDTLVSAIHTNGVVDALKSNTTISKLKCYELDTGGTRINTLIDLDWKNGTNILVPNIGTNAPSISDMIWSPASSGVYDQVNPIEWSRIPIHLPTFSFTQTFERGRQGFIPTDILSIMIGKNDSDKWNVIQSVLRKNYIVVFEDNNGGTWTFGYVTGATAENYRHSTDDGGFTFDFQTTTENKIITALEREWYLTNIKYA